jgi:hypothetical protein
MLPQKRRPCRLVLLVGLGVGLGAALAGCGKDELVPVTGKAFYKGKPLTKGLILFHPDSAKGNTTLHRPQSPIDAEGNYELFTSTRRGAPPGPYIVTVDTSYGVDLHSPDPPKSVAPMRYALPRTSGLAVEVRRGAPAGRRKDKDNKWLDTNGRKLRKFKKK